MANTSTRFCLHGCAKQNEIRHTGGRAAAREWHRSDFTLSMKHRRDARARRRHRDRAHCHATAA